MVPLFSPRRILSGALTVSLFLTAAGPSALAFSPESLRNQGPSSRSVLAGLEQAFGNRKVDAELDLAKDWVSERLSPWWHFYSLEMRPPEDIWAETFLPSDPLLPASRLLYSQFAGLEAADQAVRQRVEEFSGWIPGFRETFEEVRAEVDSRVVMDLEASVQDLEADLEEKRRSFCDWLAFWMAIYQGVGARSDLRIRLRYQNVKTCSIDPISPGNYEIKLAAHYLRQEKFLAELSATQQTNPERLNRWAKSIIPKNLEEEKLRWVKKLDKLQEESRLIPPEKRNSHPETFQGIDRLRREIKRKEEEIEAARRVLEAPDLPGKLMEWVTSFLFLSRKESQMVFRRRPFI